MVLVDWAARQSEPEVHQVQTLGWDQDAEVKRLLNEVARQVQPIMKKRGWIVPLMSEFYPSQANLLGININGGGGSTQEIRIRVRRAGDRSSLLSYESLLGTMLHELVHNVRGPHDNVFYKLLDELQDECDELIAKGISGTGVGFDGPSQGRLGAHGFIPQHNPPQHQLRNAVAQAAEARAKRARLMPLGPVKLGSGSASNAWRNMSPAEAAAAAAQRRARDDVWCPCGDGQAHNSGGSGVQGPGAVQGSGAGPSGSRGVAAGGSNAQGRVQPVPQWQPQQQKPEQQAAAVAVAARAASQHAGPARGRAPPRPPAPRGPPVVITLDDDGPGAGQAGGRRAPAARRPAGPAPLIDLTGVDDSDDDGDAAGGGAPGAGSDAGLEHVAGAGAASDAAGGQQVQPWTWVCPECTYINEVPGGQQVDGRVCDMCQTPCLVTRQRL